LILSSLLRVKLFYDEAVWLVSCYRRFEVS